MPPFVSLVVRRRVMSLRHPSVLGRQSLTGGNFSAGISAKVGCRREARFFFNLRQPGTNTAGIILIAAGLLLQSALIPGLAFEHRRRRSAEILARRSMGELANMNRVATAGELSASIAHEMKQPLAAMITNVRAGLRWLGAAEPNS